MNKFTKVLKQYNNALENCHKLRNECLNKLEALVNNADNICINIDPDVITVHVSFGIVNPAITKLEFSKDILMAKCAGLFATPVNYLSDIELLELTEALCQNKKVNN